MRWNSHTEEQEEEEEEEEEGKRVVARQDFDLNFDAINRNGDYISIKYESFVHDIKTIMYLQNPLHPLFPYDWKIKKDFYSYLHTSNTLIQLASWWSQICLLKVILTLIVYGTFASMFREFLSMNQPANIVVKAWIWWIKLSWWVKIGSISLDFFQECTRWVLDRILNPQHVSQFARFLQNKAVGTVCSSFAALHFGPHMYMVLTNLLVLRLRLLVLFLQLFLFFFC